VPLPEPEFACLAFETYVRIRVTQCRSGKRGNARKERDPWDYSDVFRYRVQVLVHRRLGAHPTQFMPNHLKFQTYGAHPRAPIHPSPAT